MGKRHRRAATISPIPNSVQFMYLTRLFGQAVALLRGGRGGGGELSGSCWRRRSRSYCSTSSGSDHWSLPPKVSASQVPTPCGAVWAPPACRVVDGWREWKQDKKFVRGDKKKLRALLAGTDSDGWTSVSEILTRHHCPDTIPASSIWVVNDNSRGTQGLVKSRKVNKVHSMRKYVAQVRQIRNYVGLTDGWNWFILREKY